MIVGCNQTTPVVVDDTYTLIDLSGKNKAEIEAIFESAGITVQFRDVQSSTVPEGQFIRYIGNNVNDKIEKTSLVRIEMAIAIPSAPIITGVEDVTLHVAVQSNPPTFDIYEGIEAKDSNDNPIPFGNFFYVLKIEDSEGNFISENSFYSVSLYQIGTYTITYEAMNSGIKTTVERKIHVVVPPFDTNHTDSFRLVSDYTNKSFITDGIGVVTISSHTDADTTNFIDSITGERFTVRYLGIDAPEATSKYDPWGIKAANYVRQTLDSAETIILEAEGIRTDGNERYLAWVWYVKNGQTRLLNLELIELAYAWSKGDTNSNYSTIIAIASAETQLTGKRIYGEVDPDYDYSTAGTPVEIGTLIDDFDTYVGKKVTVTGVITAKVVNSIFLEYNGKGIYIYTGFSPTNELSVGHEVTIQGLVPAYHLGSKQLTNYKIDNMILVDTENQVIINDVEANQISIFVGRVVHVVGLTVTQIQLSQSGSTIEAYTVVAKDINNNIISIRVDDVTAKVVPSFTFTVGAQFSVTAPVTQFNSGYQLMLPGMGSIVFEE